MKSWRDGVLTAKERKQRFNTLSQYGCVVCRQPAQIHHIIGNNKGLALKSDDSQTIPLCANHHTGSQGIHQIGVKTWEQAYGKQEYHLDKMNRFLEFSNGN